MDNKEVYIVIYYTCDDSFYDEYRLVFDGIEKVFTTKEKAEAYINKDICKENFRIVKMKVE